MNVEPAPSVGGTQSFRPGLGANYAAMVVIGLSGLAINATVAAAAGAGALGTFSQIYLVFVISAQLSTAGLHYAVLHHVASRPHGEATTVLRSAITAVLTTSLLVMSIAMVAAPGIAEVTGSDGLRTGVRLAAIGLPLHSLNKVLIAYTNGLSRMRHFALYQATRAAGLAMAVALVVTIDDDPRTTGIAFALSELALLAVIASTWPRAAPAHPATVGVRALVRFGARGVGAGLVQELNARASILVLALVVSDAQVGVFALAAAVGEGCYQVLVVLRNNINPILARALTTADEARVVSLARRLRRTVGPGALVVWLAVALLGRPLLSVAGLADDFSGSYWPVVIILGGLALAAPLLPFDQILLLAGRPLAQSALMVALLVVNLALNAALVPIIGLAGAATSTAVVFVLFAVATRSMTRRLLGLDLLGRDRLVGSGADR